MKEVDVMTTIILISAAPIVLFGMSTLYAYRRGCKKEERLQSEEALRFEKNHL